MVKFSDLLRELRPTLALALPMIVGQVSQMLIGITDSALIGRVGTVPLAAAAFTHGLFGMFYIGGIGLLMPVGVFTARDHGGGGRGGLRRLVAARAGAGPGGRKRGVRPAGGAVFGSCTGLASRPKWWQLRGPFSC